MKLLRHLLSHIILILVLFGIVTVYYYRHQILPENIAQKINSYAERIHPKLAAFSKTNQIIAVENASDIKVDEVSDKPQEANTLADSTEVTKDNTVEENESSEVIAKVEETGSASDPAVTDVPVADDNTAEEVSEKDGNVVAADLQDTPDSDQQTITSSTVTDIESEDQTASTDQEMASASALLKVARIAYHEGNPHVAIKIYKELIELENDEADYFGELGNVYYAIGSWDKAGNAYYEAAIRLIEQNQFAQVGYLNRVIMGLNPDKAELLTAQLAKINQ